MKARAFHDPLMDACGPCSRSVNYCSGLLWRICAPGPHPEKTRYEWRSPVPPRVFRAIGVARSPRGFGQDGGKSCGTFGRGAPFSARCARTKASCIHDFLVLSRRVEFDWSGAWRRICEESTCDLKRALPGVVSQSTPEPYHRSSRSSSAGPN